MNYLAHALLSPQDPHVMLGNLWGDLLRPKDLEFVLPSIVEGVLIHRKIDSFTDGHHAVDEIINLIRPAQGKYTPVVCDVIMDYILCKFWHLFHNDTIESFCTDKYRIVEQNLHLIPARLHPRINRMLDNKWLESCTTPARMHVALNMLSKRASFENNMAHAMQPYEKNEDTIDRLFLIFFEELRIHVNLQNAD